MVSDCANDCGVQFQVILDVDLEEFSPAGIYLIRVICEKKKIAEDMRT
jgi:hypothetical protein